MMDAKLPESVGKGDATSQLYLEHVLECLSRRRTPGTPAQASRLSKTLLRLQPAASAALVDGSNEVAGSEQQFSNVLRQLSHA